MFRDFDSAESTCEKCTKISGVKDIRGLRKLMKEIASADNHDQELIGVAQVPLKVILGTTIRCLKVPHSTIQVPLGTPQYHQGTAEIYPHTPN